MSVSECECVRMCTCTCKYLFVCTCVYLWLYTGVHVCVHVATSPGNDAILSSYLFLLGRGCQYLHAMPAMCQLWMINHAATCGLDIANYCFYLAS